MVQTLKFILVGFAAGVASGLFGIGGGVVMVPLLVFAARLDQHHAHATSLAAGAVLATAGAVTYASADSVELSAAVFVAAGALAGAPLGARLMDRTPEAPLKIAFGVLLLAVSLTLALR